MVGAGMEDTVIFLAMPWGIWDLSFPNQGLNHACCSGSMES